MATGVEYNLPYPGILPDHPLYILKLARDNVVSGLIFDAKKKAFYQLFLSDKKFAAGQMLITKGKNDLGWTTILKSQEIYTQVVDKVIILKDQDLNSKIVVSGVKREEVMDQLSGDAKKQKAYSLNQKDKNRVLELLVRLTDPL